MCIKLNQTFKYINFNKTEANKLRVHHFMKAS